jgi:hypothetical protein
MAPQDPKSLEAHQRLQLLLWLSMVMGAVMYFVVMKLVPPNVSAPNPALDTTLLAMAAGLVAVSFPVESRIRGPREEMRNLPRERTAQILGLTLCESAALLGVVLHFITGSPRDQLIVAVGIAGLLLHYPKRED